MKIVVDARSMGSRPSGIGMYLFNFLKELINFQEFEFVLISDVAESEYIKYFQNRGVQVCTYGKHFYGSAGVYGYFRYVKRVLKEIKPDLFWEVNTVIPVKLKGDYKVMITIHDMFPIEYRQYFGTLYSVYFKHSLGKTLKNTDMILYNSKATKDATEQLFPEAKNISNCMSYIIVPKPEEKQTESEETTLKDYLLYIGNMEKRKGVDLLLKAYEKYRKLGGEKQLVLAGKMLESDVEALVNQVSVDTGSVVYESYVGDARKQQLFRNCYAYVFPSKAEGFGIPVVEAMWYEKPVIASNLPVFQEIVGDSIELFDITGSEETQVVNLANAMINCPESADKVKYSEVVNRYLPENLSEVVRDFVSRGLGSQNGEII